MEIKTDESKLIEELTQIIVELDARDCSSNSVFQQYHGTGWNELCNKGIELFNQLKIYKKLLEDKTVECPVCKTSEFVEHNSNLNTHAEGRDNNGVIGSSSSLSYSCSKCNGSFWVDTEKQNDEIRILKITYEKHDKRYCGPRTIA